jgi:hypothetical protein
MREKKGFPPSPPIIKKREKKKRINKRAYVRGLIFVFLKARAYLKDGKESTTFFS